MKETLSNTNLDSVGELSPEVPSYNIEIATFIQEVNIKYGILLDYTVLEISEVPHWAETFQVLVRIKHSTRRPANTSTSSKSSINAKFLSSITTSKCRFKLSTG